MFGPYIIRRGSGDSAEYYNSRTGRFGPRSEATLFSDRTKPKGPSGEPLKPLFAAGTRYVTVEEDACLACAKGNSPVPHYAGTYCRSGGRNHCTCDTCF